MSGFVSPGAKSTYSGTKFALEALTDSLRRELAPLGVAVVSVNPAYVSSKIDDKSIARLESAPAPEEKWVQLYGRYLVNAAEKVRRTFAKADGPEVTTNAIVDGVFNAKPNDRYVVANVNGIPAWLSVLTGRVLPTHAFDYLTESMTTTK